MNKSRWKGSKSSNAWSLLITELEKINASYGKERTEEQLTLAINGLWKGVTMRNMQRFETGKSNTPAQASEPNREYGTGRVFTADDFYGTTADDNPLQELF